MREGDIVEFTGDVKSLLSGLHDDEVLNQYFLQVNRFFLDNLEMKFEEYHIPKCEIRAEIDGAIHFFYVDKTDIKLVDR